MNFKTTFLLKSVMTLSFVLVGCSNSNNTTALPLAQCLTEKWVIMYGTNRCSHCTAQKELFGYEAFSKINFVNCDTEKNRCGLAGVEWFPTWIFPDGTKLAGEQTFEDLAKAAWCEIGVSVETGN